eukprot:SAG31_NODE_23048_length_512_cov_1.133172_1_plen_90_part_10
MISIKDNGQIEVPVTTILEWIAVMAEAGQSRTASGDVNHERPITSRSQPKLLRSCGVQHSAHLTAWLRMRIERGGPSAAMGLRMGIERGR